jgi:lipopolysaccharide heptosyltransferase II
VFRHLQIPYRNERWLVGVADSGLRVLTTLASVVRSQDRAAAEPARILLLRLERVGDLLMVLDAIALVRQLAPRARIDLVVGSWNLPLARLIQSVDSIETLDAPWMARQGRGVSWKTLVSRARAWREKQYDLAINFEPDIRSNLLLALSGAPRRFGFVSGGGGSLLTGALTPEPGAHIATNAISLVRRAMDAASGEMARPTGTRGLNIPDEAKRRAAELLGQLAPGEVIIGLQPAAGRQIKEWDPVRFAEVGATLSRKPGVRVMLIGSSGDRPALERVKASWPSGVPLAQLPVETDLVVLAAVLEKLALFITGDTGPMHLASAVGTPVVAIFGPSLPTRYAPLSPRSRLVRIDIPCSPCNLMRRPPARCVGHVPDCLAGIESAQVLAAAYELLS